MASTQSAPAFQPHNAPMFIPPNITKEQIQATWVKYQQMKQQGVRPDDPEFLKAQNLLQAIRQHSAQVKMQKAHQQNMQLQQHAQTQAQAQMQAHAQKLQVQQNGAGSPALSNGDSRPSANQAENQQPVASSAPSGTHTSTIAQNDAAQKVSAPSGLSRSALAPEQFQQLRLQIAAFKRLSKNLPLPLNLQQQLFPQQANAAATTHIVAPATSEDPARPVSGSTTAAASDEADISQRQYETFTDPYSLLGGPLLYVDHRDRVKRQFIPSIMPVGVDVDKFVEERENIVYNRILSRRAELEKLPANLAVWDTSKTDSPSENDSLKLKAIIEYKMLCLLPKQRALRQQLSREMLHSDNLAMTANRSLYRRSKKQSLREARLTEKLEKQQRDARETKEKQKQSDFLKSITSRCEEVQKSAAAQRQRMQKLGRMMLSTHQNIEKEEQKRVERTAKQRLQALKANDEETYLKLLGQAKDTRITHLLKQTDGFLNQLASSVKAQQRNAFRRYADREEPEVEEPDSDEEGDEAGRKNVDYYEVAHRIKEEVHVQSSNLIGGTLKEYQIKGLQWMISLYNNNLNGILADEMGLGKTIQTISLITYLIEKKQQPGPYLVVVPLSTLTNWTSEFEKWAPSVNKIVYKGPPNQRKQHQQQIRWGNFQVLLTTYEFIIKDRPILSKVKWLHMIVDEGHRMKNAESKLSSTITQYYTTRYRIILTGTPLQNNLPELWALLNFVLPTIFKSVKSFDEWFNTPFANTGGQDKMELTEEEQLLVIRRLHKVLRPFLLRRLKRDVEKDLPDKTERVIKCNFSALQAKLYKQLVTHNKLIVSDGKGGKTGMRGLSNMLMQLRKLCNHPFVFEDVEDQMNPSRMSNDLLWRTAGKFELLDRILPKFQATGHRVLMFFQMTQIMNIMEDFMRLRGINYLRLDGSTKADDRSELLKLFNAPNSPYFCFLLSTRAGGLGLNLQTADTVIIYDSDWNPHQDLQAQDRAHRIGQKNEVRILRLISSNSVEEKILERANFKLDMDGKVIQAGKFDNRSTNEERDAMLRIMLESAEAAENNEPAEMDDEDLNVIMMRSDAELELFRRMDAEREASDKYGPDRKHPRLLEESELPEIYLSEEQPIEEIIEQNLGRGGRERTRVKYDDGLTEEQWLEAVDADDDTIEDAIARKEARIARRSGKKETKLIGDSPSVSREASESPVPKKRGRKPKPETIAKRKADETSLDGDIVPPPRKRGRQAGPKVMETLAPEQRATLQNILEEVFQAINDVEEPVPGSNEIRPLIDPFLELVPRDAYPDYYQIIENPISVKQIGNKINKKHYQSLKEFRQDIGLMCNNCRTYNDDSSWLFQDANKIEDTAVQKLREETASHPELQDFDDSGSSVVGRRSTAPISGAGTPLGRG